MLLSTLLHRVYNHSMTKQHSIWWNIRVTDVNQVTWEHRVLFEESEFYGAENLARIFPNPGEWSSFLTRLLVIPSGQVNMFVADEGVVAVSWHRE